MHPLVAFEPPSAETTADHQQHRSVHQVLPPAFEGARSRSAFPAVHVLHLRHSVSFRMRLHPIPSKSSRNIFSPFLLEECADSVGIALAGKKGRAGHESGSHSFQIIPEQKKKRMAGAEKSPGSWPSGHRLGRRRCREPAPRWTSSRFWLKSRRN
jgi:hypothetical protein